MKILLHIGWAQGREFIEQSGGPPVIQFLRVTQVQTVKLVLKVIHQIKTRDKQTNNKQR